MSFLNRIFQKGTQAKIDSLRLELKDLESNAKILDPIHAMLIRIAEEERKSILKHKYSKYSKLLKKHLFDTQYLNNPSFETYNQEFWEFIHQQDCRNAEAKRNVLEELVFITSELYKNYDQHLFGKLQKLETQLLSYCNEFECLFISLNQAEGFYISDVYTAIRSSINSARNQLEILVGHISIGKLILDIKMRLRRILNLLFKNMDDESHDKYVLATLVSKTYHYHLNVISNEKGLKNRTFNKCT